MNIALVLLLLTPAVDAFPFAPSPPHAACAQSMKLVHNTYNFNFPKIPRQRGLYFLHSPGVLSVEPDAGVAFFNILNASEPVTTVHSIISVTFHCRTLGFTEVKTVKMFTRERNVCNMVLYRNNRPYFVAQIRVLPLIVANKYSGAAYEVQGGHRLKIKTTGVGGTGWLLDLLLPFSVAAKAWEHSTMQANLAISEHPHLAAYRRMVLGLPDRGGSEGCL